MVDLRVVVLAEVHDPRHWPVTPDERPGVLARVAAADPIPVLPIDDLASVPPLEPAS